MTNKLFKSLLITLALSMVMGVCALAGPNAVSPNATGNSNSLIYIKKPASLSATTTEKTYTVSAAGRPGVELTILRRSNYDGQFYKVYQGGYGLEGIIGASGVFVVSIELIEGGNKVMVYAANNDERQIIKIDITRITKSQLDRINGLSVGDLFNGI
jgi:hypothetical protein